MSSQVYKIKRSHPYEGMTWKPAHVTHPTPLLFIHGATLDYRWWDDHFMTYFAQRGYICHALSLQNHESKKEFLNFHTTRIRDYVQNVVAVAAQLERPPVLIGHSMGGFVVQKYLEERFAPAAILLAPVPAKGTLNITWRLMKDYIPSILWDTLRLKRNPFRVTPEQLRYLCFKQDIPDYILHEYHSRLHLESFASLLDMIFLDLPHVTRIETPLLILGAELDTAIREPELRLTAEVFDAEWEIIPQVAHNMIHETGWELVADRMLEWLRQQYI